MSSTGFGANSKRPGRPSDRVIAFVLAVVLPLVAAFLTARYEALQTVPYALHFVAMAIVAIFGGFAPALLSVVISIEANHYLLPHQHVGAGAIVILRPLVLIISAAMISLLTRGSRRSAEALEIALATLQEQSSALIESQQASKCASWTYDSRDRTRWYPGGYEVFGIPFAELEKLPSPISLIWPEDQQPVIDAVKKMVSERTPLLVEYRVLWPNGELHWSEARGNPHEGDPHLWRGITFDITDRKLSELALIRSEKLAAMGRLASTIAHEINNPLEAVTNLLYLARRDPRLNPDTDEHLATAERELARVGEITRLALGFIRTSAERRDIEIVDGIEDVLSLFRHRFEMKNVAIHRSYEPGVTIHIAPQELRQIATNLISNALDASSPPNARVSIQIGREQTSAVLLVEDNGSGISEAHLHRIFDPFFTTKDDTGTGIGLWVTRELVEKAGGTISVQSGELPGGAKTCFRIEFPLSANLVAETGTEFNQPAVS
jgi:signal transduction histidine kinase